MKACRGWKRFAGFQGRFIEFSDPFCIGPVPALPLHEHIRRRAEFLAGAFGLAKADALARLRGEYGALDALWGAERIVLWFEHDSYDQLILAYLLRHLHIAPPDARVELISVDSVPGLERFIGIGQLAPELLAWLWTKRVPALEQLHVSSNHDRAGSGPAIVAPHPPIAAVAREIDFLPQGSPAPFTLSLPQLLRLCA